MSNHQKNLQFLETEIYKARNALGSKIMKDTFHFLQKPYNLVNDLELQRRRNRAVYLETESIQINVLEDFVKGILVMWVSFKSVLKK